MTVIPSELDVQNTFVRGVLSDLHTCMPAEIVAVRAGGADARCFVDVQPMLQRSVPNEDGVLVDEPLPVLQMVPVGYPRGGGFFVSLPLAVGDVVLVVFAERSLDQWIETAQPGHGATVKPGDLSMHSLEGAIVLPCGPAPRSALLEGVDPSDLVIGTASGSILARFTPDGVITLVEGTSTEGLDAASLASKVDAFITTLDTVFRSGWVVVAMDGGAALKTAYAAAFTTPPGTVASDKVKIR